MTTSACDCAKPSSSEDRNSATSRRPTDQSVNIGLRLRTTAVSKYERPGSENRPLRKSRVCRFSGEVWMFMGCYPLLFVGASLLAKVFLRLLRQQAGSYTSMRTHKVGASSLAKVCCCGRFASKLAPTLATI